MQVENKNIELAITFASLTLLMYVTRYLGFFAMPFVLGAYLINSIANKDYSSVYLYLASSGFLTIFLGANFALEKVILGVPFLLLSVNLILRKTRGDRVFTTMTLTSFASIIIYLILIREIFNIDAIEIFNSMVDRQIEAVNSYSGDFAFDKSAIVMAYQELKKYLASMVFIFSLLTSFIALKLPHYLLRKRGDINISEPFIEALKLNRSAFYFMLAVLGALMITNLGLNELIVDNISLMIFITLSIQGLSFIMFILKIRYKKKATANIYFALSILFAGLMFFVNIIFGFIDGTTRIRGV